MPPPPKHIKIYHITHIDNLPRILRSKRLYSDAERIERGLDCDLVGMSTIKRRRLEHIHVSCHPGTTVGQYVPFYFCPRSVMLYLLHMGNHPDLEYRGGQQPMIHLQADLDETIEWARQQGIRWAFSESNAGSFYAPFHSRVADLKKINWGAVQATDFRDPVIKEGKQAEFLVHGSFPWKLVERIGVVNAAMLARVREIVGGESNAGIEQSWYY